MRQRILPLALLLAFTAGCSGVSMLDGSRILTRAGWQHPERIVAELEIGQGDRVADIGAGDGYFLPYFSEAVGPQGLVYAVEVDDELVEELRKLVVDEGYANVEVIRGEFEDPALPDAGVDVVFLCNTYHHIDERVEYFALLKAALRPGGRVGVVDMKDDLTGVLRLFADSGHWTNLPAMHDEMHRAGYQTVTQHDFLPVQNFVVFEAGAGHASLVQGASQ